ncbi:MAG: NAD(+)/NADH kinase [Candidatus Bathyarchaeota archaeon]
MKAGLVSRPDKKEALNLVHDIREHLEERGVEVLMETETALEMELPGENTDLGEMNADLMITVGGDGTILRTAMQMLEPSTPILGVNMGSRGFLTEVMPQEIHQALDKVIEGNYALEECIKLSSRNTDLDRAFPDSLNEVLVASPLPSKAIDGRLIIDDKHVLDIQCDGIIAATPVGSTAYNLSAGGSIISPVLDSIILTAICPYSYFRSIVVPRDSKIAIELLKPGAEGLIIIDGRDYTATKPLSRIEVWVSDHKARFIRFKSFYERLERRLVLQKTK